MACAAASLWPLASRWYTSRKPAILLQSPFGFPNVQRNFEARDGFCSVAAKDGLNLHIASKLLCVVAVVAVALLMAPGPDPVAAGFPHHQQTEASDAVTEGPCETAKGHCCQLAHCIAIYWPPAYEAGLAAPSGPRPAPRALTMISTTVSEIDPPPRPA